MKKFAAANKLKFLQCFQCIIWFKSLGKWCWLFYWNIICSFVTWQVLIFQWLHIEIGWLGVVKQSTQNLPNYKMCWSRSLKVFHAANSFKGAYQCQSDIVPVACVLCSLQASLGETTTSAPWHPSVKPMVVPGTASCPTCSLSPRFLIVL